MLTKSALVFLAMATAAVSCRHATPNTIVNSDDSLPTDLTAVGKARLLSDIPGTKVFISLYSKEQLTAVGKLSSEQWAEAKKEAASLVTRANLQIPMVEMKGTAPHSYYGQWEEVLIITDRDGNIEDEEENVYSAFYYSLIDGSNLSVVPSKRALANCLHDCRFIPGDKD